MRLRHPGVRARVLLAVTVTVALALVGFVVTLERVLVASVDRRVAEGLVQEAAELDQLATGVDPVTSEPFTDAPRVLEVFLDRNVPGERETFVTVVDGEVDRSTRPVPTLQRTGPIERWATLQEQERGTLELRGRTLEYLAVPVVAGTSAPATFVVLYDYTGERREVDAAIRRAEAVAAAFLLLAVLVGWVAAGRALSPLRLLTDAASDIHGARDLDRRLPDPPGADEVATLTRTFNGMLDRLDAAFAVQRDFVADAGHELRTPITIVRGHLELMGDDPEDRRQTVALVTGELDRMARMVDDLLTLARSGRPDFVRPGPVDVDGLLAEVAAKAAVLADRRWQVVRGAQLVLHADGQRLTQAFMQLVTNAVAHSAPGSVVAVGAAAAGGRLHLWVLDHGDGVAAVDHDRIFERFARATTDRDRGQGSGLGLSIVSAIARAHGGRVEVLSTVGTGSAFVVVLPLEPDTAPGPTGPTGPPAVAPPGAALPPGAAAGAPRGAAVRAPGSAGRSATRP